MINDLFKIVVDPICPPKIVPEHTSINNFELVYQDGSYSRDGITINRRRPFSLDLVYPWQMKRNVNSRESKQSLVQKSICKSKKSNKSMQSRSFKRSITSSQHSLSRQDRVSRFEMNNSYAFSPITQKKKKQLVRRACNFFSERRPVRKDNTSFQMNTNKQYDVTLSKNFELRVLTA